MTLGEWRLLLAGLLLFLSLRIAVFLRTQIVGGGVGDYHVVAVAELCRVGDEGFGQFWAVNGQAFRGDDGDVACIAEFTELRKGAECPRAAAGGVSAWSRLNLDACEAHLPIITNLS